MAGARLTAPVSVVAELADLGVDVDALVKLEVDEADVVTYPPRTGLDRTGLDLAARLAAAQPKIRLR